MTKQDKAGQTTTPAIQFSAQIGVGRKPKVGVVFLPGNEIREDPERGTLISVQDAGGETRWIEPPKGCFPLAEGAFPPDHLLDVVICLIGTAPRPGPVGLDGRKRVDIAELAELWRGSPDDLKRLFNR